MLPEISKQAAEMLLKKATDLVRNGEGRLMDPEEQQVDVLQHLSRNLSPLHGMMASYEMKKVLEFVKRETVGAPWLLGISGMRGVGKTTLLRHVRDSYGSSFSYVFFVGAGTGCTVARLQHVLCVNLGRPPQPQMSDSDVPMAKIISRSLRRKTFLLLLDDLRESQLDLAAVGLPMPLGHRQKVIFTTRNQAICVEMGCTSNTIHMDCLGEDDAWNLFKDKVGEQIIDAHPHIKHLANKMAAECRGLPSTLCALGRAMSTKRDVKEWRYAYDMLIKRKRKQPVNEIQEIDDEGNSDLHRLEDELQDSAFF